MTRRTRPIEAQVTLQQLAIQLREEGSTSPKLVVRVALETVSLLSDCPEYRGRVSLKNHYKEATYELCKGTCADNAQFGYLFDQAWSRFSKAGSVTNKVPGKKGWRRFLNCITGCAN